MYEGGQYIYIYCRGNLGGQQQFYKSILGGQSQEKHIGERCFVEDV